MSQVGHWPKLKADLQTLFPPDVYDTWFAPLECLREDSSRLVLGAPTEFSAIWIKDNYIDLINRRSQASQEQGLMVDIEVITSREADNPNREGTDGRLGGVPEENGRGPTPRSGLRDGRPATHTNDGRPVPGTVMTGQGERKNIFLNPRNTFPNFIVGDSNQLAHAACVAVAKAPARAYNPLFLYGETGLGKTHLMHATAHCILEQNPGARIVYTSCEKFTNEFIRAIQENTLVQFRRFYRSVDVLLIDDIHFLAGKERIQEEFFHTFNELFESQRQLCLSSDRPASEISKLENRLISRFQWGMVTDIQAPDFETRLAILRKKSDAHGYEIDETVLTFLAERITRNVRRMEGALTRVASYASLTHKTLDVRTCEKLLQDILQEEAQNQITIEKIQAKVVEYYQLRQSDMVSKRRPSSIAFPRQIAMYLSRMLTSKSLVDIGEGFGGRDHGTVIHAIRTVENMMEQDPTVRRAVDFLTQQITSRS